MSRTHSDRPVLLATVFFGLLAPTLSVAVVSIDPNPEPTEIVIAANDTTSILAAQQNDGGSAARDGRYEMQKSNPERLGGRDPSGKKIARPPQGLTPTPQSNAANLAPGTLPEPNDPASDTAPYPQDGRNPLRQDVPTSQSGPVRDTGAIY